MERIIDSGFPIYTAQLNVGKSLKDSFNVKFIDITQKSGTGPLAEFFAPTWGLVSTFKTDGDWDKYVVEYEELLNSRDSTRVEKYLMLILSGKTAYDAIVFGCYCGDSAKCHRSLAATWCAKKLGMEYEGDIKSDMISVKKKTMANTVITAVSQSVFDTVKNNETYAVAWAKKGVRLLPADDLDDAYFSASLASSTFDCEREDLMAITGLSYNDISKMSNVVIRVNNPLHDKKEKAKLFEGDNDNVIKQMFATITVYEEPNDIDNLFELETCINARCFIDKHVITK